MHKNNNLLVCLALLMMCTVTNAQVVAIKDYSTVTCGAAQFEKYLPLLENKRVAVLTNITGILGKTSIVDTLISRKVNIIKIFGPEHGFRMDADAGEKVKSNIDQRTGLQIVSLYGSNKKPTAEQLKDIDVLIYDIQDIGTRFYTYISTMCYAMEACAENKKQFIVLDRPNPNGFYIDGPVLKPEQKSFLGLHAVPLVYGMTCGEYAKMANGEGWLSNKIKCNLTVITMQNYDRKSSYRLPVKPSPNIPDEVAVLLYPSLGLFEGTIMSLGRGTSTPFKVVGHPEFPDTSFSFTPVPTKISQDPKYVNKKCYGLDLQTCGFNGRDLREINLQWLFSCYAKMKRDDFFDKNFNFHAGNAVLQEQVKNNVTEKEIRRTWQADIEKFKQIRKKYLLYADL